jgi:hypothetical protein
MSNGTRPGVLMTDLLSGDGPHSRVADQFLVSTCRECRGPVDPRGTATDDGAYYSLCYSRVVR